MSSGVLRMGAHFCRVKDHVWITTEQLVRFHKNEFDDMPCELESTENSRKWCMLDCAVADL